jgi:hypothetical protein
MIENITVTTWQWLFIAAALFLLLGIVYWLTKTLKIKEYKDPKLHLYLINKKSKSFLAFNLNDINGIRQFNETNKPILCL